MRPFRLFEKGFLSKGGKVLLLSASLIIVLPIASLVYIYVQFQDAIFQSERFYSIRLANYLSGSLPLDALSSEDPASLARRMESFASAMKAFQVYNLKVFSRDGTTVYSHDGSNLGAVNRKPYFLDKVAKGEVFQKFATRSRMDWDAEPVTVHLLETYIPLMRAGEFQGALEVYSDLTPTMNLLHGVTKGVVAGSVLLGLALYWIIFHVDRRAVRAESALEADALRRDRDSAMGSLRQAMSRFHAIVSHAPMAVVLCEVTRCGRVFAVDANDCARRLMGLSTPPGLGVPVARALRFLEDPVRCPDVAARVEAAAMDGRAWEAREAGCADGACYDVWCFRTGPGQAALLFMDSTDRRAGERALVLAKEQAEQASRAKSAFLAHMSHEVRTPLNGILGMLQVLDHTRLETAQRDCVHIARQAGESLLTVINDILDLSKVEAGRLELASEPFSIRGLLDSVRDMFTYQARSRMLSLSFAVAPDLPETVRGDAVRVRQVLINLVGNAVKFTDKGGVHVSVVPAGSSGMVAFHVADTGPGMTAEKLATLFEPFRQDSGLARRHQGTGLGLSISKRLVELMGGTIVASSQPGNGSLFSFTIPLAPADECPSACPGEGERLGGTVLLAEDDQAGALSLERLLCHLGLTVLTAHDGQRSLEILESHGVDLVLMDVRMPGMDGVQAARAIRSGQCFQGASRVPIVAVSAHCMDDDRQACLDAGMDDFISKPISLPDLVRVIRKHLPGRDAVPGERSGRAA